MKGPSGFLLKSWLSISRLRFVFWHYACSIRVDSYSPCPFVLNFIVDHVDRVDQRIYFLYQLFDGEIEPYATSHIIRCLIHCIFISKHLVANKCALIKTISTWSEWRIQDRNDKRSMNTALVRLSYIMNLLAQRSLPQSNLYPFQMQSAKTMRVPIGIFTWSISRNSPSSRGTNSFNSCFNSAWY